MENPYAPSLLVGKSTQLPRSRSALVSVFLAKHFLAFQISFVFIWFGLGCMFSGVAKTFEEAVAQPHELLIMPMLGAGVWLPHAILAVAWTTMRRIRASVTAISGSIFFLLGMLIFQLLLMYLPRNLRMPLSWTPTPVLVTLYLALSIAAVSVVVRFQSDRMHEGG